MGKAVAAMRAVLLDPASMCSVLVFSVDLSFFLCVFFCFFLQLHCLNGIPPMGNLGCLPHERPAATESRYPTCGACWVFFFSVSIIHQTLTWTTGSLTFVQMSVHVIAHRGVWTP